MYAQHTYIHTCVYMCIYIYSNLVDDTIYTAANTCIPRQTNSRWPRRQRCHQCICQWWRQNWPCISPRTLLAPSQHSPFSHPMSSVCSAAELARRRTTVSMASTHPACSSRLDSPSPPPRSDLPTGTRCPAPPVELSASTLLPCIQQSLLLQPFHQLIIYNYPKLVS